VAAGGGHYEEPLVYRPRCGCARHFWRADGDEQRLQEQPTRVVRSNVHRAAAHKNWAQQLRSGN
jgi:hypothetical protein